MRKMRKFLHVQYTFLEIAISPTAACCRYALAKTAILESSNVLMFDGEICSSLSRMAFSIFLFLESLPIVWSHLAMAKMSVIHFLAL